MSDDFDPWPQATAPRTEDEPEWPNDYQAELWLLATMMHHPQAVYEALDTGWQPADMYRPFHDELATALAVLADQQSGEEVGRPIDPVAITDYIGRGHPWFTTGGAAALLARLLSWPVVSPHPTRYAAVVHEHAMKRRLIEGGIRQIQNARNPGLSAAETLTRAETDTTAVTSGLLDGGEPLLDPADMAADVTSIAHNWALRGMVDRTDKIILVAPEGSGKSVIGFQMCWALGIGTHPFVPNQPVDACRTMYVDLEVNRGMLARRARDLKAVADHTSKDTSNIRVWSRPTGLDLRKADNQVELIRQIRKHGPDFIAMGPMYKMGVDSRQAEGDDFLRVAEFLDRVRHRYGCALWLEQHAPLPKDGRAREMRPEGTNMWLKWPDFGIALVPDSKAGENWFRWTHYRRPRERRTWPEYAYWRPSGQWGWPWAMQYAGDMSAPLDRPADPAVAADMARQDRQDELSRRREAAAKSGG